jgi:hypothetical protein
MHVRLYETSEWLEDEDWMREAAELGIPRIGDFVACMQSPSTHESLLQQRMWAARLGPASERARTEVV